MCASPNKRDHILRLVRELPEGELHTAQRFLEFLRDQEPSPSERQTEALIDRRSWYQKVPVIIAAIAGLAGTVGVIFTVLSAYDVVAGEERIPEINEISPQEVYHGDEAQIIGENLDLIEQVLFIRGINQDDFVIHHIARNEQELSIVIGRLDPDDYRIAFRLKGKENILSTKLTVKVNETGPPTTSPSN